MFNIIKYLIGSKLNEIFVFKRNSFFFKGGLLGWEGLFKLVIMGELGVVDIIECILGRVYRGRNMEFFYF